MKQICESHRTLRDMFTSSGSPKCAVSNDTNCTKLYKLVMIIICFGVRALGMKQICSCTVYALESAFNIYEAMILKVSLVGRCSFSVHEHQSLFFISFFCFLFLFLFVFSSNSSSSRRRSSSSTSSSSKRSSSKETIVTAA